MMVLRVLQTHRPSSTPLTRRPLLIQHVSLLRMRNRLSRVQAGPYSSINDVLKIRYKQFTGVIMVLAKPVSNFKIAGLASTVKRTVASKLHKIFLCDWFAKLVRAGKVIPRNNVQCLPF